MKIRLARDIQPDSIVDGEGIRNEIVSFVKCIKNGSLITNINKKSIITNAFLFS